MTKQPLKTGGLLLLWLLPFLTGFSLLEALLAPKAELWERWIQHDPDSDAIIDHSPWSGFLKVYLVTSDDGINRLRYAAVAPEELGRLADYIAALERVSVSRLNRSEQKAYWVNLYNAQTVLTVIEHYPVDSIRKIKLGGKGSGDGPWAKKLMQVEGEALSLNDIEHRILRPIWQDPRVHYAVNCASIGCPNLQSKAYTSAALESMLEAAARAYVNHPRGVRFDRRGRLRVASIYNWFQADFGAGEAGVLEHLRHYAEPELAQRLGQTERIHAYGYDWSLNDVN